MSQENVEIVRQIHAAWEQGTMTAGVEYFDAEIAFESFMPDSNETAHATGSEEIAAFMREFLAQWRDYRITGDEFIDAGDKVLATSTQAARGRQSGAEVELRVFSVWTFRDGKVVALRFTPDRELAIEAAGLGEQNPG